MTAKFILSLDCEGKWGVADCLTRAHQEALADDRLAWAYGEILRLLDEHQVAATFAFAGLFSQSAEQFTAMRAEVEAFARHAPDYLHPALRDMEAAGGSGWHGAQLVEAAASARTAHEIALHGVTHVPWTEMNDELVDLELRLFEQIRGQVRQSQTFVYPRNLVAHIDALESRGFVGYRKAPPVRSRAVSLASEFNFGAQPEAPTGEKGMVAIPAGYFLNWRSGPRLLVPAAITMRRARALLNRAEQSGRVVHYWLHPENIATAPATLDLLSALLAEVARRRDSGRCEVLTQLDYCHWARTLA